MHINKFYERINIDTSKISLKKVTLGMLVDYHNRREGVGFFSGQPLRARKWLIAFLNEGSINGLPDKTIDLVVDHVLRHTANDFPHDLSSTDTRLATMRFFLEATKRGVYPWKYKRPVNLDHPIGGTESHQSLVSSMRK